MVYRPIPDSYHKITHFPPAEFKVENIRIVNTDNIEKDLEIGDDYFLLRVKYSGDRQKTVNMIIAQLEDIEGEYYSQKHDFLCTINA